MLVLILLPLRIVWSILHWFCYRWTWTSFPHTGFGNCCSTSSIKSKVCEELILRLVPSSVNYSNLRSFCGQGDSGWCHNISSHCRLFGLPAFYKGWKFTEIIWSKFDSCYYSHHLHYYCAMPTVDLIRKVDQNLPTSCIRNFIEFDSLEIYFWTFCSSSVYIRRIISWMFSS